MGEATTVLEYASYAEPPPVLTLQQTSEGVRVIFPAAPTWGYLARLAVLFVVLEFWLMDVAADLSVSLIAIAVVYEYYRRRRVPRVLIATRDGLARSRRINGKVRSRFVPSRELVRMEFLPVKGYVGWKQNGGELVIRSKKDWPVRLLLASADAELPMRIAQRLAASVGCPLTVAKPARLTTFGIRRWSRGGDVDDDYQYCS